MSSFQKILDIKGSQVVLLKPPQGRLIVCPDMGGRVYAEILGYCPHRIDLETVRSPTQEFNNFGGMNLWPAPEGGPLGFNYQGDQWYVQRGINQTPFRLDSSSEEGATMEKRVSLINRAGVILDVSIRRQICWTTSSWNATGVRASFSYLSQDEMRLHQPVSTQTAVLSAWNLEQFQASPDIYSFVQVSGSREAVNFDFYEPHPVERIRYFEGGLIYQTDGQERGQIGISHDFSPLRIGFYDLRQRLVCIKEHLGPVHGTFFNIADNAQTRGVFAARDSYSIFNSPPEMNAFELETIAPMQCVDDLLLGSCLRSSTTFMMFDTENALKSFLGQLGVPS